MTEQLEFSVSEEGEKFARENFWTSFIIEIAHDSNGTEYHRKKGSKIVYKKIKDGFECVECGSEIMAGKVAHSIWDGPFSMSGSGKCHYEDVPYCPKCEEKPNFNGTPIDVK